MMKQGSFTVYYLIPPCIERYLSVLETTHAHTHTCGVFLVSLFWVVKIETGRKKKKQNQNKKKLKNLHFSACFQSNQTIQKHDSFSIVSICSFVSASLYHSACDPSRASAVDSGA